MSRAVLVSATLIAVSSQPVTEARAEGESCEHQHAMPAPSTSSSAMPQQRAISAAIVPGEGHMHDLDEQAREDGSREDESAMLGEHAHHRGADGAFQITASLGLVVADYDARLYSGDYEGLIFGASVTRGRFGLAVKAPAYRIVENGREVRGAGDVMLHAHATVLTHRDMSAGMMLMASAPTGNARNGLGMGHVMLMPEAFVSWSPSFVSLTGSVGYGYAFGGASAHADHGGGMWPLVDPMNARELTYAATGSLPLSRALAAGVRFRGATPIGSGDDRLIGGVGIVWRVHRVQTTFDVQRGLVGDPFGTRGTLETSIAF